MKMRRVTIGCLAVTAAAAQVVLNEPKKIADAKDLLESFTAGGLHATCSLASPD